MPSRRNCPIPRPEAFALGDQIALRGLRARGHHGAIPGEQDRPQAFEVDLDLEVDLSAAGRSDHLSDTVDYGAVAQAAARVVSDERWHLLERLAERIADEVLASDDRVEAVVVTIRKLNPPVSVELGSAGVSLVRRRERAARRRAFIGLGSNLGDRAAQLREAVAGLPDVVGVSPVYETEPVGGPPGQPPFLNVVVELSTARSTRALLEMGQRLEAEAGRVRGERDGPRTLDVDVLWVEGETVDEPDLVVPHPRMHDRRFVMAPLADLAPFLAPPGWEARATGAVRKVGPL